MKPEFTTARTVIVQPEPVLRYALREYFGVLPRFSVRAVVAEIDDARAVLAKHKPDLIVMDLVGDTMDALDFINECACAKPPVAVVVFSVRVDFRTVQSVLKAGGLGYVSKRDEMGDLLKAISLAMEGRRHLGPKVEAAFMAGEPETRPKKSPSTNVLTEKEHEVFKLLGMGDSIADIATKLKRERKTVESQARRIREKLNIGSLRALVHRAVIDWAGRPAGMKRMK